ncbi:hypothetical protein ACHAPJ_006019 [Fusarium lateritium]
MEADARNFRILAPDSVDGFYLDLAAKTGNVHRLRLFVKAQAEYPPSEKTRESLLSLALQEKQMATVEFLLKQYPPIFVDSQTRDRLLSLAVQERQMATIEFLLKNYPPSYTKPKTKERLLSLAVQERQMTTVEFLVEYFPPRAIELQIRQRLLLLAVQKGRVATVEFLLRYCPPTRVESQAVHSSILSGSERLVSAILSTDQFIINRQFAFGGTPLITACESGQQPEFLKFLLNRGADPNMKCATSKLSALEYLAGASQLLYPGNRATASIALMLNSGANIKRPEVLMAAVRQGREDVVGYLLEQRLLRAERERGPHDKSVLHVAASGGSTGIMRILFKHGVDVSSMNEEGKTAMQVVEDIERETGRDMTEVTKLLKEQLALKR